MSLVGHILITAKGTGRYVFLCYFTHVDHKPSNTESHINQENGDRQTETSQMFCAHLLCTLIPIALEERKTKFAEQLCHRLFQKMFPLSDHWIMF